MILSEIEARIDLQIKQLEHSERLRQKLAETVRIAELCGINLHEEIGITDDGLLFNVDAEGQIKHSSIQSFVDDFVLTFRGTRNFTVVAEYEPGDDNYDVEYLRQEHVVSARVAAEAVSIIEGTWPTENYWEIETIGDDIIDGIRCSTDNGAPPDELVYVTYTARANMSEMDAIMAEAKTPIRTVDTR